MIQAPPALNLPPAQLKLRATARGVEIYDRLREKWVIVTPEEWVRQNFVNYLVEHKGFPAGTMANEIAISLNGTTKRCDTVIYDRTLQPLAIVEYKAPHIPITQKVFDQIVRYNLVMNVKYLIISNGMQHYCCEADALNNRCKFLKEIPAYRDIT